MALAIVTMEDAPQVQTLLLRNPPANISETLSDVNGSRQSVAIPAAVLGGQTRLVAIVEFEISVLSL